MNSIGKNIRLIRTAKNMSQEALAEALFVTRQTVSNYEVGRSRPDVEMLMQIAAALDTDIHALLYGPPVPEEKRAARRRLLILGGALLLLSVGYGALFPICRDIAQKHYFVTPLWLLRLTLRPALLFLLGWFGMQLLTTLTNIKIGQSRRIRFLRIGLIVVLGILILLPLPYIIFLAVGLIQYLSVTHVTMIFPHIPVYTDISYGILWLQLEYPFIMAILGLLCPLAGLPPRKNADH